MPKYTKYSRDFKPSRRGKSLPPRIGPWWILIGLFVAMVSAGDGNVVGLLVAVVMVIYGIVRIFRKSILE